jgi:RNA polymerase sigma-70 factor, ECF subfamily
VDQAQRQRLQQDLVRLADGDREAFHPVFVALLPLLRGFASRSLSPVDAEDVAQEALVKLFMRAAEFDRTRDALSWILGITAYEIKTARRRQERRRESDMDRAVIESREDATATPEALAIARDLDGVIDAAMQDLSPADAATLRAFAVGEPPAGVAPATFRKRVERGLARLRALWRATHGER